MSSSKRFEEFRQEASRRARIAEEMAKARKALKPWNPLTLNGAILHLRQVLELEPDNTDARRLLNQAHLLLQVWRIGGLAVIALIVGVLIFKLVVYWGPALWNQVMAVYGPTPTPTATPTFTLTPTVTPTATPTSTPTITPTPTPTPVIVRLTGNVKVFTAPDSGSTLVGFLSRGDIVQVHAIYGDWALVSTEFMRGWVALEYAKPLVIPQDIVTPTPIPTPTAVPTTRP
jgi:hypothetical protein